MTKAVIVSSSDSEGGAARASYRIFSAIRLCSSNIQVKMVVASKKNKDEDVITKNGFITKLLSYVRYQISKKLLSLQQTSNNNYHSGNWFPSGLPALISKQNPEIVNIHWVNNESISVEQVGKLSQHVVLTLHDMWGFCGAEHYVDSQQSERYIKGYDLVDDPANTGLDINKHVWIRKKKAWNKKKLTIVSPSTWLTSCAQNSALFKGDNFNFETIPNPLDLDVFKPCNQLAMRELLGLPRNKVIIGFGALSATKDKRKGYDLLELSLHELAKKIEKSCTLSSDDFVFLLFGSDENIDQVAGFNCFSSGHLNDDTALVAAYNAMDMMLVPSRLEAFGQAASEALACGVPVICFDASGLKDVVVHKENGYLASPYDVIDFADGILWVNKNKDKLAINAREHATNNWSYDIISKQYDELFTKLMEEQQGAK